MLRSGSGYKAQCGGAIVFVVSDFDEWRVLLRGPDCIIKGGREFSEDKAKEQAARIVEVYLTETDREASAELEWTPIGPREWLNWSP